MTVTPPRTVTPWPRAKRLRAGLGAVALAAAGCVSAGLWTLRPDLVPFGHRGGPFDLVDQRGTRVTERDLAGRPALVYFGYTHCPDICPTTLFELAAVLAVLGPDAAGIRVVFVTMDPVRDTPPVLAVYLSAFDSRILGLTGTPDAVAALMRADRIRAIQVPYTAESYTIDYTDGVLILDAAGHDRGMLDLTRSPAELAAALRPLIAAGPARQLSS